MAKAEVDTKAMIEEHAEKGTKIFYRERKKVEIIKNTKHYKEGQVIEPHKVMADQLIKDKVAKAI